MEKEKKYRRNLNGDLTTNQLDENNQDKSLLTINKDFSDASEDVANRKSSVIETIEQILDPEIRKSLEDEIENASVPEDNNESSIDRGLEFSPDSEKIIETFETPTEKNTIKSENLLGNVGNNNNNTKVADQQEFEISNTNMSVENIGDTSNLILDPDLGVPAIIGNQQYISANSPPMTPEMQAFSVMAIEPDQTYTRVIRAWITTNMMPKKTGEITGKREMQGSSEAEDVNIDFTGTTRVGKGINDFATRFLKSIALKDARPYDMRAAYTEVSTDLTDTQESFKRNITQAVIG